MHCVGRFPAETEIVAAEVAEELGGLGGCISRHWPKGSPGKEDRMFATGHGAEGGESGRVTSKCTRNDE